MTEKLSNFDFSGEESHLALVCKEQGGAANGYKTVVTKSRKKVEKAIQNVTVEFDLPTFLQKFFFIFEEDAKALAYLLGYRETELEDGLEQVLDYQEWLSENAIMIKMNEVQAGSPLQPEDMQEVSAIQEGLNTLYTTVSGNTVQLMKSKLKTSEQDIQVMKSTIADLTKKIEKATSDLYTYKEKEKEAMIGSRKEQLTKAIGKFDEILFDSIKDLPDGSFDNVVKALKPAIDSNLFVQKSKVPSKDDTNQLMAAISRLNK